MDNQRSSIEMTFSWWLSIGPSWHTYLVKYRCLKWEAGKQFISEPRHLISNNVAFLQVQTHTNLCSLRLNLETPNDVRSVA